MINISTFDQRPAAGEEFYHKFMDRLEGQGKKMKMGEELPKRLRGYGYLAMIDKPEGPDPTGNPSPAFLMWVSQNLKADRRGKYFTTLQGGTDTKNDDLYRMFKAINKLLIKYELPDVQKESTDRSLRIEGSSSGDLSVSLGSQFRLTITANFSKSKDILGADVDAKDVSILLPDQYKNFTDIIFQSVLLLSSDPPDEDSMTFQFLARKAGKDKIRIASYNKDLELISSVYDVVVTK